MNPLPLESLRQQIPAPLFPTLPDTAHLPHPFPVQADLRHRLERLGLQIQAFVKACNDLYALSAEERQPGWIARLVDQGKTPDWITFGRLKTLRNALPALLEPELVLTAEGLALTDLNLVPAQIGTGACLQSAFAAIGIPVLGGKTGLLDAFRETSAGSSVLLPSRTPAHYPGLAWLASRCDQTICDFERFMACLSRGESARAFRFFSLACMEASPQSACLLQQLREGTAQLTPIPKPQLEERLWLALLSLRPLRAFWRRTLSDRHLEALLKIISPSWVVDPTPLPPQAEIAGLGIRCFEELADSHQNAQAFALRPTRETCAFELSYPVPPLSDSQGNGFSDLIRGALESFPALPHILQRKPQPLLIEHPFQETTTGRIERVTVCVRLRPVYSASGGDIRLAGLLAGLTPASGNDFSVERETVWVPGVELRE